MVEVFDRVGVEPVFFGPPASYLEHSTLTFRISDALFAGFEVGGPVDVACSAPYQADDLPVEHVDGLANVPDTLAIFGAFHAWVTVRTRASSALSREFGSALRAR
jgi:hypothetical protein